MITRREDAGATAPDGMVTWGEFVRLAPEVAAVGRRLFGDHHLAYLATTRRSGAPRLHPVAPVETEGGLFIAANERSPKRWDLSRDGRYASGPGR